VADRKDKREYKNFRMREAKRPQDDDEDDLELGDLMQPAAPGTEIDPSSRHFETLIKGLGDAERPKPLPESKGSPTDRMFDLIKKTRRGHGTPY